MVYRWFSLLGFVKLQKPYKPTARKLISDEMKNNKKVVKMTPIREKAKRLMQEFTAINGKIVEILMLKNKQILVRIENEPRMAIFKMVKDSPYEDALKLNVGMRLTIVGRDKPFIMATAILDKKGRNWHPTC